MAATDLRDSVALLETAFDAGIRHVDTAPSYGLGQAERCVGEFVSRHRDAVTVTTKYGIPAPKNQSLLGLARVMVRPVIARSAAIKQRLQKLMTQAGPQPAERTFTVADAQATLENSLRMLRVERIDVWLLHEARAEDLDERMLRFIEDNVRAGKVGTFGVGSDAAKIAAVYRERRAFCPVIQCEWDPLQENESYPGSFRVHHSIVREWGPRLSDRMDADGNLCARWSAEIGLDLADPAVLAALLIKSAILSNPLGMTLFSSKKRQNILRNVQIAEDPELDGPASRLQGLIRREMPAMLQGLV